MAGKGNATNNPFFSQDMNGRLWSFREWLDQGRPSFLMSQIADPGISSEDLRRNFIQLMNLIDTELTSRGIGFLRMIPENHQAGQQGNISNANGHMQAGIVRNPTEPEGPANPILISSETYVLGENGNGGRREGASSSNGSRLSFKRRAPEDAPRILLRGESSGTAHQPVDAVAHGNARNDHLNNLANFFSQVGRLDAGAGYYFAGRHEPQYMAGGITGLQAGGAATTVVNHHQRGPAASTFINQASNQARQAETLERNTRFRRNPNPQDFTAVNRITQNHMNYPIHSPNQTAMLFQYEQLMNLRDQQVHQQYVEEPSDNQQVQFQVQGVTMSEASLAAQPPHFSPMAAANINLANIHGIAAASQEPSVPNSFPPDQAIRYSNQMQESLRFSGNQGPQGDYRAANAASAASAEDVDVSVRGDTTRIRSRPRRRTRQAPRESSQIQNSLTIERERERGDGGGLRFLDVTWVAFPQEDDEHEDLRMNIDDMSYEELIALGEQIGKVPTGLSEDFIFDNLRIQIFDSLGIVYPGDAAPKCCICLEKYVDEDHVSKINCGHHFHSNCIKLWLMCKNECPVCKNTGLAR